MRTSATDCRHRGGYDRGALLALGLALTLAAPLLRAQPGPAPSGSIWQLTYLKAQPGRVEQLAQFIERNWFAMDARARAAGHLEDFVLLRGTPADSTWDLLEITTYRDSAQHARIDSLFRVVYRPQHQPVLIDGLSLTRLGRIVTSVTTRRVGGSP